ncbi:MAG: biopolymer transporter ExbD [Planctomycetaceae bacterium]|nr:biopolymer transporter ExbD [Planctomycetaceae bacterium]
MAIQFRCPACKSKLSIAERKAGAVVACPACREEIEVPVPAGAVAAPPEGAAERRPTVAATSPSEPAPSTTDEDDEDEGFVLSRRTIEDEGLDMTPMVDVTFLLLIFFMITASFSLQKSMQTEAPEEDKEGFAQMPQIEDLADQAVIVEIDERNTIFVDDQPVGGLGELQDVLLRPMSTEQKREMIIEPNYQAKHGTVVAVLDTGIEVGMQRVRRVFRSEKQ